MESLLQLCDQLRVNYGEEGLQRVLQMIVTIGARSQLLDRLGASYGDLREGLVTLKWPRWFAPTTQELSQVANTLRTHTDASHMSQETAAGIVAQLYDIPDEAEELQRIAADDAQRASMAPQVKEVINA